MPSFSVRMSAMLSCPDRQVLGGEWPKAAIAPVAVMMSAVADYLVVPGVTRVLKELPYVQHSPTAAICR